MSINSEAYVGSRKASISYPEYQQYQQYQQCANNTIAPSSVAQSSASHSGSASQTSLNPASDSWVPSAQQALNNALQSTEYNMQGHGFATTAHANTQPIGQTYNGAQSNSDPFVSAPQPTQFNMNGRGFSTIPASNIQAGGQVYSGPQAHHATFSTVGGSVNGMNNGVPPATSYPMPAPTSHVPAIANQLFPVNASVQGTTYSSQLGNVSVPHGHDQPSQPGFVAAPHDYSQPTQAGMVQRDGPFYANPVYRTGIPQSNSAQTIQNLMSPGDTPSQFGGRCTDASVASPEAGRLTEPRNYAPRTAGLPITHAPPPKFNLEMLQIATQPNSQDPFGPVQGGNALVIHQQAPTSGSQALVITNDVRSQRSDKLNMLTGTPSGLPTYNTAVAPENFPFTFAGRMHTADNANKEIGVVKLKNIPFATKRSEVIAFLGRNCKILNDTDEPVHIIMERATSKTMDAYVEFQGMDEAAKTAEKHHQNTVSGRVSRLGDRPVEVELSSQASLMRDLFPLARGVFWDGPKPVLQPFNPKEPWENFKGFISAEEMTMLVKHVEVPHRSPFSKECPQRPYECLISTLRKFPWNKTDCITIAQRQAIFKATCELLRLLARSVDKGDDPINLNSQLYRRVVASAMGCPGFTALMKDDIAWMVNLTDLDQRSFGQPRFANSWVHQHSTVPKAGVPLDVIEVRHPLAFHDIANHPRLIQWYIAVIREQTHRDMMARSHQERGDFEEQSKDTDMYWGYFWIEAHYTQGPQFDHMTLSQADAKEITAIERILSRALPN
ncbi:Fc.00g035920.m01.CDS01 [Cosmosporella sp. VM-42]